MSIHAVEAILLNFINLRRAVTIDVRMYRVSTQVYVLVYAHF